MRSKIVDREDRRLSDGSLLVVTRIVDRAAALATFRGDTTDPDHWRTGLTGENAPERAARLLADGIALPAARDAYESMRESVERAVTAQVLAFAPSARRKRRYAEEGQEIDTARVAAGDPDHWASRHRVAKRRTFRLALNVCVPSSSDPTVFARIVGSCAAASDALYRQGYGVEVTPIQYGAPTLLDGSEPAGVVRHLGLYWPAKEAHEPLDVERILSAGSPAMLRMIGFSARWSVGVGSMGHGQRPEEPIPEALTRGGIDYCFGFGWAESERLTEYAQGLANALFGAAEGACTRR
jgi:hypothetical protein